VGSQASQVNAFEDVGCRSENSRILYAWQSAVEVGRVFIMRRERRKAPMLSNLLLASLVMFPQLFGDLQGGEHVTLSDAEPLSQRNDGDRPTLSTMSTISAL